jgi:hypothetical protein
MPPLRMPPHATLCSSCLNCQSNFRLKVFLLFLTPTAVSFFVYSFFCFSRASVLPDLLNWLFTLPPLRMPPHVTLCSSICVSASVVLHSCSSTRVPAVVFQHLRLSSRVPAVVFQHLRFIICDSAVVFQHSCSSSRVSASTFQQSCFSIVRFSIHVAVVFQQSCFSIHVPAVVQHSCSSSRVPASVIQPTSVSALVLQRLCTLLCCSICVRVSVTVCSICERSPCACSIFINDNLIHLR